MNTITYILRGFGFKDPNDFFSSIDKTNPENFSLIVTLSVILGTIREFTEVYLGLHILVLCCFVFLIVAEWLTGTKADIKIRGKKFESRKFGRMLLKVGVYVSILFVLFTFSSRTEKLDFFGIFDVNPFRWVYYIVFVGIFLQMLISWFENLAVLGYKEMNGIVGILLRKGNKWFEFDGTKDGDNFK